MVSEHEHHELTDFQNGAIEGCKFSRQVKVTRDLNLFCQTVSTFLSRNDEWKSDQKLTESDVRYLVHTAESETHVPLAEIAVNTTFSRCA